MSTYKAETYGEQVADVYDGWYGVYDEAMIDLLAELAHGGRALELGIGTGRVALPLAARGVEVHGIDASPKMVARLRAKPGGAQLPVRVGDFADVQAEGDFDLVFIVFNTFFAFSRKTHRCAASATSRRGSNPAALSRLKRSCLT